MTDKANLANLARIDMATAQARTLLRLVGPRVTAADDAQDNVSIRLCLTCNPPPEEFVCPACDHPFDARWKLKMHIQTDPSWCKSRARQKTRAWSNRA